MKQLLWILLPFAFLTACMSKSPVAQELDPTLRLVAQAAPVFEVTCARSDLDGDHWMNFQASNGPFLLHFASDEWAHAGKKSCKEQKERLTAPTSYPVTICGCHSSRWNQKFVMNCIEVDAQGRGRTKIRDRVYPAGAEALCLEAVHQMNQQ